MNYDLHKPKVAKVNSNIGNFPQPDPRDRMHQIVSTLVSPLPYVEQILTAIVKAPLDKRREEWLISVAEALIELQNKHESLTPDSLVNNPSFTTAILNSTLIAIRTHKEEKLSALRNIVLNSALPEAPDDDAQQMFIQMLDTFTTWHLELLKFFAHSDWYVQLGYDSSLDDLPVEEAIIKLEILFPELKGKGVFLNRVVNDLSDNRLIALPEIRIDKREMIWTGNKVSPDILSELGCQFLQFIASPLN